MKEHSVLETRNIHKGFPGIWALQAVNFILCEGEIHALMGENGAGKSTLIEALTGVHEKDKGEIYLSGLDKPAITKPLQDTQNLGISTMYQEVTPCPNLAVAENMYIGRGKSQIANWKKINGDAERMLNNLGVPAQATQQLSDCSIAIQQMVVIARVVDMDCKVLVLDEPASSLDESGAEKLLGLMWNLKARGVGIILVTHFLDQVYEVCDKTTVLWNGQPVGEYVTEEPPRLELVTKMFGKELDDMGDIKGEATGYNGDDRYVIEVEGLQSDARTKPFDFHIKKDEVNGFTGLLSSGWSECVRALFCADKVIADIIRKNGKPIKTTKPLDVMKNSTACLPEDRKRDGIVGDLSVQDDIVLAAQALRGSFKPSPKAEVNKLAEEYIKLLEIKMTSADTPIKSLPGGNQQKVILARWLLTHPEYLILDEPIRGIDIGTKVETQKLVPKLALEGMSLTLISSEIDEMLRTCSRLIVMWDRRVVGELPDEDSAQSRVMETTVGDEML